MSQAFRSMSGSVVVDPFPPYRLSALECSPRIWQTGRARRVEKTRCGWADAGATPAYLDYHDQEWGVPVHDDRLLFEFLILEGAQAGLSWSTILNKRHNYQRAFEYFDPARVARFTEARREKLLQDPGIVRNRLKVAAAIDNARCFLEVQKEFGSFANYLWGFVDGRPVQNHFRRTRDVPASTPLSDRISKDLKKRGFRFVGTTIIYAYLQATGVVNDHLVGCFRHSQVARPS
ncbi:MAG TPA: DNA-3-methyladenine glycosylase I [Gammaproteobacteria bacterium]